MAREVLRIPAQKGFNGRSTPNQHKIRVAAYCRVSTDQDEQLNSFENQVNYYTEFITNNPNYELAGIYADEGISGTSTRHREQFIRMIKDCETGKIDLVITKSISRFARNTQDCLNYSRRLKELGIGIKFEKEGISTLDGSGELLFTILSSLAQDESRSISENSAWGIRSLFKQGVIHLNANHFYGYDKDERGRLVINPEQSKVVRWIFESYMNGVNQDVIVRKLNEDGIPGCSGVPKWTVDTIFSILTNEKHMGDAILQKTYTVDFMTKKQVRNEGQLEKFYIQDDHEPIVSKELWNAVQQEVVRKKQFMKKHGLRTMGRHTDTQPFTNRVFCGVCGCGYWRRRVIRNEKAKFMLKCKNNCLGKEGPGCSSDSIWEADLDRAFIIAWNAFAENRADMLETWKTQASGEDPLQAYRAKQFMKLTADANPLTKVDSKLVATVLEHIDIMPMGILNFYFLDGSTIQICIND